MSVIVIQRKKAGVGVGSYLIPAGGEILWFGLATALPSGWQIVSAASGKFVMGAAQGGATDTQAGANSHKHTFGSATGSAGGHTHTASTAGKTASTTHVVHYPTANDTVAPDGHTHEGKSGPFTSSSSGSHTHAMNDTGTTEALPPFKRMYWIKAIEEIECPVNGIVLWNDLQENTPEGFAICNGNNGTPDMRDKFVYVATADGEVGNEGGSETHTHTNSNTDSGGSHKHLITVSVQACGGQQQASGYGGTGAIAEPHEHSATGYFTTQASHSHGIGDTGASSHIPQFMYLYYVMRKG